MTSIYKKPYNYYMRTINSQTRENKMLKERKLNQNKKTISLNLQDLKGYNNRPNINLDSIPYRKDYDLNYVSKGIKIQVAKGLEISIRINEKGFAYIDVHNHLGTWGKSQKVKVKDNSRNLDARTDIVGTKSRSENCDITVNNFVHKEGVA